MVQDRNIESIQLFIERKSLTSDDLKREYEIFGSMDALPVMTQQNVNFTTNAFSQSVLKTKT